MRKKWMGLIAVALVAVGCSGGESVPATPGSGTTGQADPSEGPEASSTSAPGVPASPAPLDYDTGDPVETGSSPSWDDADRAAVIAAAVQAVTLFARPDLSHEQWWEQLAPVMSVQAQIDYQYVDPLNVPAGSVTGAGVIVEDTSASVAGVEVPTEAGPYTVVLSRTAGDAPWLVERITLDPGTP